MDVLNQIKKRFSREKPLEGLTIGMALHVEAKTACLVEALVEGGAEVAITGCNPLSTDDDVAKALSGRNGVSCYARYGLSREEYYKAINKVLDHKPDIVIDDGADLIFELHMRRADIIENVVGASEETTTGVNRIKVMEAEGVLKFPVIAVNNALTKFLFDNRYGTGQSTWDGIIRTTNILIAGKNVVVAGYGWCGKGIALRAKGLGANVIVTEVDPVRALEALMDGFRVMPMEKAVEIGDIFITATGNRDIIQGEHFLKMKNGALLANAGHFNVEIDVDGLEKMAKEVRESRKMITEYNLGDKKLYVLAEGRLVNLVAGDGHPIEVMDMSFSNQALCAEYLWNNRERLENRVYDVPSEIDRSVAEIKLETIGVKIDTLTDTQIRYLSSWRDGT
jgi:adenosylhomocysteinase